MPYCTVCKGYADYEDDVELFNGDYLHYSCLLRLQMRQDEIETALRRQKPQLILSIFVQGEVAAQDVASSDEIKNLSVELTKLKSFLTSIYDHLPSLPPDWEDRKQQLIRQNDSVCSKCGEAGDVYLCHAIPLFEGGTNELENLVLICKNVMLVDTRKVIFLHPLP